MKKRKKLLRKNMIKKGDRREKRIIKQIRQKLKIIKKERKD